jgi:hypothetical protein
LHGWRHLDEVQTAVMEKTLPEEGDQRIGLDRVRVTAIR